jgi:ABC-type transport system substrate-binding protein
MRAGGFSRAPVRRRIPGLYRLSIPGREFEPYIANGMPSVVTQEGELFTATVRLREGLTWSDGSPLTARDVSFTVERALRFHLGQDWASAYDPELLRVRKPWTT